MSRAASAGHVALARAAPVASVPQDSAAGRFALLDREAAAAISEEWRTLSEHAAEDSLFFDPDFALAAVGTLGRGVLVATWRGADGRLAALAPVTSARLGRIAPAMRLWSHDYGPLAMPLVDRQQVRPALRGLLSGLAGSGSLLLPDIWVDGAVAEAIRDFAAATGRPLIVLGEKSRAMLKAAGGTDCRKLLSGRRRAEYGRQMRRLGELGKVAIESSEGPALFEEFLLLEAGGWKGRGGTAMREIAPIAAMARDIVAAKAAHGALRIFAIRLDGRVIAMLVCFLSGRSAYTWKIAYDETFARFSPGAQVMMEAGTGLLSIPGVDQVDSCAEANHPMADHVWKDRRGIGTVVIGPAGGGALFNAGLAAMRGEMAARATAKELIKRLQK
jgi:CelD/BcsL family acetyltransferase involved in cellulose biosynthesis